MALTARVVTMDRAHLTGLARLRSTGDDLGRSERAARLVCRGVPMLGQRRVALAGPAAAPGVGVSGRSQ